MGRNLDNAQSAILLQRVTVQPIRWNVTRTFTVPLVNIFRISKYSGVVHAFYFTCYISYTAYLLSFLCANSMLRLSREKQNVCNSYYLLTWHACYVVLFLLVYH